MTEARDPAAAIFDAWNGLWQGALAGHNRRLRLAVEGRWLDRGAPAWQWRVAQVAPGSV